MNEERIWIEQEHRTDQNRNYELRMEQDRGREYRMEKIRYLEPRMDQVGGKRTQNGLEQKL